MARLRLTSGSRPPSMPPLYEADLSAQQSPPQAHSRISGANADAFRTRGDLGASPQRPQKTDGVNSGPVVRESFSREDRLRKRREFEECYASGVRVSGRHLQLFLREHPGPEPGTRLGISVPRRAGIAVARNRLRRRLREIFRRNRDCLGDRAMDLVIQCRPSAAQASFAQLTADYLDIAGRARARTRRK